MDFARVYKTEEQIREMVDPYLEWDRTKDPTLLYGRIFRGGYEAMFDPAKSKGSHDGCPNYRHPRTTAR